MSKKKRVIILAGTIARGEELRDELGIDAEVWSTYSGAPSYRGPKLSAILVDGSAKWSAEIQEALRPISRRIYWVEPAFPGK